MPLPDGGVRLCGDNTDWQGVYFPVAERLKLRGAPEDDGAPESRVALVLGAGGTAMAAAYAARRLGLALLFWNRTLAKAEALAQQWGGRAVERLDDEDAVVAALGRGPISVVAVLCTLPPAAADFTLPAWVFADVPVVLDAAYTSERRLLQDAAAHGCPTIAGAEMLVCQGLPAFAAWVGRAAACGDDECDSEAPPPALPACVPAAAMAAAVAASFAARK